MSQNIDLDTTLAALERGLKSIPTDEALAIIDTWYQPFRGTALGEDLRQVREAIENGDQTGVPFSDVLIDLGANAAAATGDVDDDVAAKVQQIGTLLAEAGNSLK